MVLFAQTCELKLTTATGYCATCLADSRIFRLVYKHMTINLYRIPKTAKLYLCMFIFIMALKRNKGW